MNMESCPLCGNGVWNVLYKISEWDIKQCEECDFARIHPFPSIARRQEFYCEDNIQDRKIRKKRNAAGRAAALIRRILRKLSGRKKGTMFLTKLTAYLNKGDRLLDIGCGSGAILREVNRDFQCVGVEISDYFASEASKLNVDVYVGDFCAIDFKDARFNGITMVSLLEHLYDPVEALEKCYRLLEDDGVLLLKTVNHQGFNRRILKEQWSGYRPPDHLVYFAPENLRALLLRIGFRSVKMTAMPFNDSFYCDAWK